MQSKEDLEHAVDSYLADSNASVDEETRALFLETLLENEPMTTYKPKVQFRERLMFASLQDIANFVEYNK